MWMLRNLINHSNGCSTQINGNWVPARPLNYRHRGFFQRLREAWAVFTGKAEAFTWPEGQ